MPLDQLMTLGIAWPIARWGDPVLHHPCRPVTEFGPDLWNLLCDMFATNTAANEAGLAAPQIGVDLSVFVYDCLDAFARRRQGLACNPQIVLPSQPQTNTDTEGCLSLPGAYPAAQRRELRRQHQKVAGLYPNDWPT